MASLLVSHALAPVPVLAFLPQVRPVETATLPSPWAIGLASVVLIAGLAGAVTWHRRMRRVVASKVQAEALSARRRQEAEDALRATERQMQQLVQSVKAIVWRRDLAANRYTFVSQEAEQLLGYPVAHWVDEPGFVQGIIHADDRAWVSRYSDRATAERRDHTMEYRVFAQDGRLVWLRDIVSVMIEHGEPRELVGVMIDISEYKAAEEALEAAHAHALAATRVKSEFLASMSHEIRTPMNAVIGITDLLLDTPLTAEQRQFVETVRSSGDVLLNVINDILDFSKVEAGQARVRAHRPRSPSCWPTKSPASWASAPRPGGSTSRAASSANVPRNLIGDPGRLRQVLLNLVGNAIKFTETRRRRHSRECVRGQRDPRDDPLRGQRHRHRHHAGGAGASLRCVHAGRRIDDASLRRHRPRPGHLASHRRVAGRPDRRRQRAGRGRHLLVHGAVPARRRRRPSASSPARSAACGCSSSTTARRRG